MFTTFLNFAESNTRCIGVRSHQAIKGARFSKHDYIGVTLGLSRGMWFHL